MRKTGWFSADVRLASFTSKTPTTTSVLSVSVLYFARARELVGVSSEYIEVLAEGKAGEGRASVSLHQIRVQLVDLHPAIADVLSSPSTSLAVNCSYVDSEADARVFEGDEVAVIPAVSGG